MRLNKVKSLLLCTTLAGMASTAAAQTISDLLPPGFTPSETVEYAPWFVPEAETVAAATKKSHAVARFVPQAVSIELDAWDGVIESAKSGSLSEYQSKVRQIAQARSIAATENAAKTARALQWSTLGNGNRIAAVSFTSHDAYGVRLGLKVDALPGAAIVRSYTQENPGEPVAVTGVTINELIQANIAAGDTSQNARIYWTPYLNGEEATIEIEVPAYASSEPVRISIPELSHFFESVEHVSAEENSGLYETKDIGDSDACQYNTHCLEGYNTERRAVARMIFNKGGYGYYCSGTMLNDSQSSGTPFFVTAAHCIDNQTVASTLQTDWLFYSATCSSKTLAAGSIRLTNGARLLYSNANYDTTLLELNSKPGGSVTYAGWLGAGLENASVGVFGMHHPSGDLQKVSTGEIKATVNTSNFDANGYYTSQPASGLDGAYLSIQWTNGTTEGGSSGSGVFSFLNGSPVLVGVLKGGASSCTNTAGRDTYGRFDLAYADGIKPFLTVSATPTLKSIYRFYNTGTGAHFYTQSVNERDSVIVHYPSYHYEGEVFKAYDSQAPGTLPVYRFYNTAAGTHFYTMSANERDSVLAHYPSYNYEGETWFARGEPTDGSAPLFRFYNTQLNYHFYTMSQNERDSVIQNLPAYHYEGVGYYAWPLN